MKYNIPVRLAQLRKHQTDIIKELKKKGIKVAQAELSRYVNGVEDPPKSVLVLSEADKILKRWEEDAKSKAV